MEIKNNRTLRIKMSFLLAILILLTSVNSVCAGTEGVSTISMNVINPEENGSIQIMETDSTTEPEYLMPQQKYDIKIKAIKNKGIGSINSLEIKLWLDESGDQIKESQFNDVKHANGATVTKIKWDKAEKQLLLIQEMILHGACH